MSPATTTAARLVVIRRLQPPPHQEQHLGSRRSYYARSLSFVPPLQTGDNRSNCSCLAVLWIEPALCLLGLALNATCLCFFQSVSNNKYFRKTSLVCYLAALAACNCAQLLLSLFVIVLPAVEQTVAFPEWIVSMTSNSVSVGYPMLLAANYAAIWILCLACAQRFQAICEPTNRWKRRLQWVRRSRVAVLVVLLLAVGLNVIRFWETTWNTQGRLVHSELREHVLYKVLQEGLIYGLVVYALPLAFLLWVNIVTIRTLRRHRSQHRHLVHATTNGCGAVGGVTAAEGEQHDESAWRWAAERRAAFMTISIACCFILCTSLGAILRLAMILRPIDFDDADWLWLVDLSNLMINANSALVTPVVLCASTRAFQDLFFALRPVTGDYGKMIPSSAEASLLKHTTFGDATSAYRPQSL